MLIMCVNKVVSLCVVALLLWESPGGGSESVRAAAASETADVTSIHTDASEEVTELNVDTDGRLQEPVVESDTTNDSSSVDEVRDCELLEAGTYCRTADTTDPKTIPAPGEKADKVTSGALLPLETIEAGQEEPPFESKVVPLWEGFHGLMQYNYYRVANDKDSCTTIVILAVGTAMGERGYVELARHLCRAGDTMGEVVTIIADPSPGFAFAKWSKELLARQVNRITSKFHELIPVCSNRRAEDTRIVVGGHSSGGRATLFAVARNMLTSKPIAFLGLDLFFFFPKQTQEDLLTMPSLFWGFSTGTCSVSVGNGAASAYQLTQRSKRILFQTENADKSIRHCSFTDSGCNPLFFRVCPIPDETKAAAVRNAVGISFEHFLKLVKTTGQLDVRKHRAEFEALDFPGLNLKQMFLGDDPVF